MIPKWYDYLSAIIALTVAYMVKLIYFNENLILSILVMIALGLGLYFLLRMIYSLFTKK